MFKIKIFAVAAVALFVFVPAAVRAQTDEKKFEVGGQFSMLWVPAQTATTSGAVTVTTTGREAHYGFGGRFGYNISKYFTLEAEGNFFPRDRDFDGGRKIQGLFGVKAGKRFEKFGVFGKARPGFVRFKRGNYVFGTVGCPTVFPPPLACLRPVARTNFAIDLGGVVEFYPSKRTIVRFDAGDTIGRVPVQNLALFFPPPPTAVPFVVFPESPQIRHNFQGSVGFGFRF